MIQTLQNITRYYFGKNAIVDNLSTEIKKQKPHRILLMYGGGSIKKNGIYNTVVSEIKKTKIPFIEHSGIKPNPINTDADQAIALGRKNKVDLIIAVGGGSVIDEAKVVATGITNLNVKNCWSLMRNMKMAKNPPVSIFSVITIAATGSENNYGSVITNTKTHDKWGVQTPQRPIVCFEDPTYTFSVSPWQTSSGIFDIFSHLLEQFYDIHENFDWTKQYLIANMKIILRYYKKVLKYPNDYDARANILWTSSWALNGMGEFNTSGGDWAVHGLEHALSGKYDVSHGAGLALITPTYIEEMANRYEAFRILTLELAQELFGVHSVKQFLKELNRFIKDLGLPAKYSDFKEIGKITQTDIDELIQIFDRELSNNLHQLGVTIFNKIPK